MRSGVRIPFHFEVAEAQRVADEKERLRLERSGEQQEQQPLLSDAGAIDPAHLLKMQQLKQQEQSLSQQQQQQREAAAAEPKVTTLQSSSSSSLQAAASTVDIDAASAAVVLSQRELELGIVDKPAERPPPLCVGTPPVTADSVFVQTPADPPSLTDFDNLNKMAAVPRYDAFYQAPFVALKPFRFSSRFAYLALPRQYSIGLEQFINVDEDQAISVAHAFRHNDSGVTVTLLPVVHIARPRFWRDSDELCCQHHSVLLEGRYSPTSCDISVVPPRDKWEENRPEEDFDAEGWEPPADRAMTHFRQPYSWGVRESPMHTIVHAADCYDYDKLPLYARLRHNVPFLGNYKREKHCLNVLHQLTENGYESFVIPWGVAHMPVFSKMLLQNGFTLSSTSKLVMFDRVDGPMSTAYVRKLRSSVSLGRRISDQVRLAMGMSLIYLWGYYLGVTRRDFVDFEDMGELGMDSNRRRAWDKAMSPGIAQSKLRHGGLAGPLHQ